MVTFVKVYDRTSDVVISYVGTHEGIIDFLRTLKPSVEEVPKSALVTSGRELNNSYQEKFLGKHNWS